MRLMHSVLEEPILFQENQIQVLVIENPVMYRRMVADLIGQSEGEEGQFILSLHYDVLDMAEHIHVIQDFCHLEPADRKIQTRFLAMAQQIAQERLQAQSMCLTDEINRYLNSLAGEMDVPISFDAGDKLLPILKSTGFHISLDGLSTLEALAEHLSVCSIFLKEQCFVLIGAKAYFSPDELEQLYQIAVYKKWRLLLVEPIARGAPLKFERISLIDQDLCMLHLNEGEHMW